MSEKNLSPIAGALVLSAPVESVLVLEDRAQVVRRARLEMKPGRQLFCAGPITPLCADHTLRCRLKAKGGQKAPAARLVDARVMREYVTRPARPEAEKSITAAIEAAITEYRRVLGRAHTLREEWQAAQAAAEALARYVGDRVGLGMFSAEWGEEFHRCWAARDECGRELVRLWFEQQDRERAIRRLEEERWAVLQPVSEYRAWLVAELQAERADAFEVEFEYQVPCALWRPQYTAELRQGRLYWQSAGMVWQLTGEDWRGVELRLSTARPTLGAELPLLEEDRIGMRPKSDQERKVIEVSSRDQVIARTESAPARLSDTPLGLEDGGEARTFAVPGRVDVPSDGRPHRLPYEEWEAACELEHACCPELAPFVFLRSLQTPATASPLLAGPVHLVREGGFMGRSSVGFVAAGERFALSFGSDDELVVLRRLDRRFEETAVRKQQVHEFSVQVYLQNQSLEKRRVKVYERIPVSEISQVEVELHHESTTPGFRLDEQGLCCWEVPLAAGEEKRLELQFSVRMPGNVRWDG